MIINIIMKLSDDVNHNFEVTKFRKRKLVIENYVPARKYYVVNEVTFLIWIDTKKNKQTLIISFIKERVFDKI